MSDINLALLVSAFSVVAFSAALSTVDRVAAAIAGFFARRLSVGHVHTASCPHTHA